ncbi:hypothetical protein [Aestuariicoccus sp. MJ-SS9]|uniref:hypothetical protein n=1 Tax=Aestuariicoccus sp. MJ-SS9 TaxID=3079855 RepID=UPI002907C4EE|nr:hypothetical protein [Aestuariicoccus sp. MJ-SS9]MDU8913285.1 hypothetical protein [Aestuariicoccus sp. MJ-SS9]
MDTFSLMKESVLHSKNEDPAPTEFKAQLVAVARAGRSIESLAREYVPCPPTIHDWVQQAGAIDCERDALLTKCRAGQAAPVTP